jgi:hypothetical protein
MGFSLPVPKVSSVECSNKDRLIQCFARRVAGSGRDASTLPWRAIKVGLAAAREEYD